MIILREMMYLLMEIKVQRSFLVEVPDHENHVFIVNLPIPVFFEVLAYVLAV